MIRISGLQIHQQQHVGKSGVVGLITEVNKNAMKFYEIDLKFITIMCVKFTRTGHPGGFNASLGFPAQPSGGEDY